jgi:hypothetical protein
MYPNYKPAVVISILSMLIGENKLVGRVTSIGPGTRPLRDAITGEALPTQSY